MSSYSSSLPVGLGACLALAVFARPIVEANSCDEPAAFGLDGTPRSLGWALLQWKRTPRFYLW